MNQHFAEIIDQKTGEVLDTAPKPSMFKLLATLKEIDDGMLEVDVTEHQWIAEAAQHKVDDYKYIVDKMEAEVDRLDRIERDAAAAKKAMKNQIARLKRYFIYAVQRNEGEGITGNLYEPKIRSTKSVKVIAEPTSQLFALYPQFIRRKYEWEKTELKKAILAGDAVASQFAALEENLSLSFEMRKGIEK